jgi:hypothetical protein
MTVSQTTLTPHEFSCTGVTEFPVTNFDWDDDSDLIVTYIAANGAETVLTYNADYTVADGTVTYAAAPSTGTLHITRETPITQDLEIVNGNDFDADTINAALDKQAFIAQELAEESGRALKVGYASGLSDIDVEDLVAEKFLQVNSAGDGIAMGELASAGTLSVSDFGEALLAKTAVVYIVDPSVSDQGAVTVAGNRSIKDIQDRVGATKSAEIWLMHTAASDVTTFSVDTDIVLTGNFKVRVFNGAWFDQVTGDETVTIDSTWNLIASPTQQVTAVNMLRFTNGGLLPPGWFGGTGATSTIDDYAALQLTIDCAKTSYDSFNSAQGDFGLKIDLFGHTYRTETSLDMTEILSPNFTIQNGGIYGACSGKIVLDVSGTYAPIFKDLKILGDKTDCPSVGLFIGRTKIGGAVGLASRPRLRNVTINGYFSKAACINFAAEVSNVSGCKFENRHRSLTAYAYACVGHADTLDDFVGGLTSDYTTLPVSGDGSQSNTIHYMEQVHMRRASAWSSPVLDITNANPAVVSVEPSRLAFSFSGLSNGDEVFFHTILGMTEINGRTFTVANINESAGTFELSGEDSTGHGAFILGDDRVWTRTGPAILLSGVQNFWCEASYILTYGATPIVADMDAVGNMRDINIHASFEADTERIMEIHCATSCVIQGSRIDATGGFQSPSQEAVLGVGGGTVRMDHCSLRIEGMSDAPANQLFNPPALFSLYDADLQVPSAAALNDPADFATFSGKTYYVDIYNRYRVGNLYGVKLLTLTADGTTLTEGGFRYTGSGIKAYDTAERNLSLVVTDTSTNLADITAAVNTTGKYTGKRVWNTTTSRPVFAAGGTAGGLWVYSDGTTAHTPV